MERNDETFFTSLLAVRDRVCLNGPHPISKSLLETKDLTEIIHL